MKVSIALATYNGEKYLQEFLDSLMNQKRLPDQIIIRDDCSKDETWSILEKFVKDNSNKCQILLHKNEANAGYKENFRRALEEADGDYIFLADQDDLWDSEKIATMMSMVEKNKKMKALASSFRIIDGEGKETPQKKLIGWSNQNLYKRKIKTDEVVTVPVKDLILHNICQGCALVIARELRDEYLEHYTDLLPHDWLINILAAKKHSLYFFYKELFSYRIHGANTTGLSAGNYGYDRMSYEYRTLTARDDLKTIKVIKKALPDVYAKDKGIGQRELFLKKHIHYLKHGKTLGIIKQIPSPFYHELKSWKAILADLIYTIKH